MKIVDDIAIVLAGEAGQGIQSIESMLTSLAKRASYHVFATKEYMSRVRGGCNSTEIRISSTPVSARVDRIDLLVPLTPESIPHLESRITESTVVVGEKGTIGYGRMIDVPFTEIATAIGSAIYSNTVAVGTICALLGMDEQGSAGYVRAFFARKGEEVQERNGKAFLAGYERGKALRSEVEVAIGTDPAVKDEVMLTGAEAVALGSIAAGCDYVCAYPMSPGTTVLQTMAEYSKKFDILVEQVEDEIGVANMTIGAWYAGARAMATTSGGGFALMTEAVSLAGAIETPMVVHIAQRPGPATGLPTRTEQADLNLAVHSGHGDFLRVILAPGDLEEGYELAKTAFDIADHYQSPVFLLTDQYFVDSYYTVPAFRVPDEAPIRYVVKTDKDYKRYALKSQDGLSPRGIPGWGDGIVCADSDEHTEAGYITEDASVRVDMVGKRLAKITAVQEDVIPPRLYGDKDYRVLLVGWGSVKGPVIEAISKLERNDLAFLHFPWVYPLPEGVREYLEAADTIVDIEGNATGQFADLLQLETGIRIDKRVLKFDGYQFSVEELAERISAYL
jgi:2-oxoglutarate/2-oxoacid ferredoxin oxidoreductase subunit alpha